MMPTATCRVCGEPVTMPEAPLHAEDHAQRGEFPNDESPAASHKD